MQLPQFEMHAALEERHWWFLGRRRIVEQLLQELLAPGKRTRVVDVGCGTGGNTAAFDRSTTCIGIDPIPEAIAFARERFPSVRFLCGTAPRDIPDEIARADAVLLLDVLEHVEDDVLLVSELLAEMKPGAYLLLMAPADSVLWGSHDRGFEHYRRYTLERLRRIWKGLPVSELLVSHCNARLYPPVKLARIFSRMLGRSLGPKETDLSLPPRPLNTLLHWIFAGEAWRIIRALRGKGRGYRCGVSIIAVLRREPGEITPRPRPTNWPRDPRPWMEPKSVRWCAPLANLLLAGITFIIMLGAAEGFWRAFIDKGDVPRRFDPLIRATNPPNAEWHLRTSEYQTTIRTNSLGFRTAEFPTERDPKELRILFLGDSFVEAKQVPEQERFAEQVGRSLEKTWRRPVRVAVLGIGGASPVEELLIWRQYGRRFKPAIVVQVLFPENDIPPHDGPYRIRETSEKSPFLEDVWVNPRQPCSWKCQMLQKSKIVFHTYQMLRGITGRFVHPPTEEDVRALAGDFFWYTAEGQRMLHEERRLAILETFVRTLREEVERDRASFLTVLMPGAFEVQEAWREEYIRSTTLPQDAWRVGELLPEVVRTLEASGTRVLSLLSLFQAASRDDESLYYRKDPHLSPRGHAVTAEAIAASLRSH